jgi:hypothetical protein
MLHTPPPSPAFGTAILTPSLDFSEPPQTPPGSSPLCQEILAHVSGPSGLLLPPPAHPPIPGPPPPPPNTPVLGPAFDTTPLESLIISPLLLDAAVFGPGNITALDSDGTQVGLCSASICGASINTVLFEQEPRYPQLGIGEALRELAVEHPELADALGMWDLGIAVLRSYIVLECWR